MKKFLTLTCGVAALFMTACSSDEPLPGPGDQTGKENDVYANLTLHFPNGGTRAGEEGDDTEVNGPNGYEIGKDDENFVSRVLIVLATKDETGKYKYLTKAESDVRNTSTENTIQYTLSFSSSAMVPNPLDKDVPGANLPGQNVYVFAYCNPTASLINTSNSWSQGDEFLDAIETIDSYAGTTVWKANNFLMTNCEIPEPKALPSRDDLVKIHNTPENAFDLGIVSVKRAAARFDFQTTETEAGVNKYTVYDVDDKTPVGVVELTHMALFNVGKSFYYIPRSSQTWDWKDAMYCKDSDATSYSFVVSTEQALKQAPFAAGTNFNNYFFYPVNTPVNDARWTSIADWNERKDNDDNWFRPGTDENSSNDDRYGDYRIWRYVTENTIPAYTGSDNVLGQRAGITTGVVFKGEFLPADTELWNGNAIYTFNNIVFGDFKALKEYVSTYPESKVALAFGKVENFKDAPAVGSKTSLLEHNGEQGFKAYVPTEYTIDGNKVYKYTMYYYYYNRHNNNGVNTTMGINEFGVVRNNVYKLRVNMLRSLGRPDVPDPDDEDEEEHAYFTVSCRVMPWTVRVNDIDF